MGLATDTGTVPEGDHTPQWSLLYPPGTDGLPDRSVRGRPASLDTLRDLALDPIIDRIATRVSPHLGDVATTPLTTVAAVHYRQQVFASLREPGLRNVVERFGQGMREVASHRARQGRAHYVYEAHLWAVHADIAYVRTVETLVADFSDAADAGGNGMCAALSGFAAFVLDYVAEAKFVALREHTSRVERGVADVRFAVWAHGGKVTVAHTRAEPDLQQQVLATFERFRQSDAATSHEAPASGEGMDHVQAAILDRVARLFPELFADIAELVNSSVLTVPDPTIGAVADELGFFLAVSDILAPLEAAGLPTCLPEVEASGQELNATHTWDLALGIDLVADGRPVVTNDLELNGPERIIVVSGPNQGGKTTMARTFGQLHHLAALGVPVQGRSVRLMLADQVLTVFEREEVAEQFGGRLGEELARVHRMFDSLTPRSVVVLNEVFSSTALADAKFLARTVLERLIQAGIPTLVVTFIDELSRLGPATVSMVSVVDSDDLTVRTFRLERRQADGRAYADALATRYGLSRDRLVERLAQ